MVVNLCVARAAAAFVLLSALCCFVVASRSDASLEPQLSKTYLRCSGRPLSTYMAQRSYFRAAQSPFLVSYRTLAYLSLGRGRLLRGRANARAIGSHEIIQSQDLRPLDW